MSPGHPIDLSRRLTEQVLLVASPAAPLAVHHVPGLLPVIHTPGLQPDRVTAAEGAGAPLLGAIWRRSYRFGRTKEEGQENHPDVPDSPVPRPLLTRSAKLPATGSRPDRSWFRKIRGGPEGRGSFLRQVNWPTSAAFKLLADSLRGVERHVSDPISGNIQRLGDRFRLPFIAPIFFGDLVQTGGAVGSIACAKRALRLNSNSMGSSFAKSSIRTLTPLAGDPPKRAWALPSLQPGS